MQLIQPSELEEIISKIANNEPDLTKVELGSFDISLNQIQRLANALTQNTNVTHLSFVGFLIDDQEVLEAITTGLVKNKSVTHLDFSGCFDEDSEANINPIANLIIRNSTLDTIILNENNFDEVAAKKIAQALMANKTLKHFYINENLIGNKGVEYFSEMLRVNKTLVGLHINTNDFNHVGAESIGRALEEKESSLQFLDISGNPIRDNGVTFIAKGVEANQALVSLLLDDIGMTAKGSNILFAALQHNVTLRELDVSHNALKVAAAVGLSQFILINKTLQILALSNVEIDAEFLVDIEHALKLNKSLQYLNLDSNMMELPELIIISKILIENDTLLKVSLSGSNVGVEGAGIVLKMLQSNITLRCLDLNGCHIGGTVAAIIANGVADNRTLIELSMAGNEIGDIGAKAFGKALSQNQTLRFLDLSECGLDDIAIQYIALGLSLNSRLQKMVLKNNPFTQTGEEYLYQALLSNRSLVELEYKVSSEMGVTPSTLADLDFDSKSEGSFIGNEHYSDSDDEEEKAESKNVAKLDAQSRINAMLIGNVAYQAAFNNVQNEMMQELKQVPKDLVDIVHSYSRDEFPPSTKEQRYIMGINAALIEYKVQEKSSDNRVLKKINQLMNEARGGDGSEKFIALKNYVNELIESTADNSINFWRSHSNLPALLKKYTQEPTVSFDEVKKPTAPSN